MAEQNWFDFPEGPNFLLLTNHSEDNLNLLRLAYPSSIKIGTRSKSVGAFQGNVHITWFGRIGKRRFRTIFADRQRESFSLFNFSFPFSPGSLKTVFCERPWQQKSHSFSFVYLTIQVVSENPAGAEGRTRVVHPLPSMTADLLNVANSPKTRYVLCVCAVWRFYLAK